MSKRFTAVLKVVQVEENAGTGRGDDRKVDHEVVNITVRAKTLESLQEKLKAHIDLAEEL